VNITFVITILLALLISNTAYSATSYGDLIVDEVTSVYDGDTFRVNIKNMPPLIGNNIAIRVAGIDTPEIRGKCKKEKMLALQAKQMTVTLLRSAKKIELRNVQRGKYFRIIANVYIDNHLLSRSLLKENLAVFYNGGKKTKDWCSIN